MDSSVLYIRYAIEIGNLSNFNVIASQFAFLAHPRVVSLAALRQFTSWQSVSLKKVTYIDCHQKS